MNVAMRLDGRDYPLQKAYSSVFALTPPSFVGSLRRSYPVASAGSRIQIGPEASGPGAGTPARSILDTSRRTTPTSSSGSAQRARNGHFGPAAIDVARSSHDAAHPRIASTLQGAKLNACDIPRERPADGRPPRTGCQAAGARPPARGSVPGPCGMRPRPRGPAPKRPEIVMRIRKAGVRRAAPGVP